MAAPHVVFLPTDHGSPWLTNATTVLGNGLVALGAETGDPSMGAAVVTVVFGSRDATDVTGPLARVLDRPSDLHAGGPPPDLVVCPSASLARAVSDLRPEATVVIAPSGASTGIDRPAAYPNPWSIAVAPTSEPRRLQPVIDAFTSIPLNDARLTLLGPDVLGLDDDRIDNNANLLAEVASGSAGPSALVVVGPEPWFDDAAEHARRIGVPLIVADDAGAAIDLVTHGVTGLVVEPSESRLRWAMDHLATQPWDRWSYAQMGIRRTRQHDPAEVARLLLRLADTTPRPRVLILSTYSVDTPINGGQRRLRQLATGLARHADVTLAVLHRHASVPRRVALAPGLTQLSIPRSAEQLAAEDAIADTLQMPTDDITAARLSQLTPDWGAALRQHAAAADVIVSSHPYLAATLPDSTVPVVYDCHNDETSMKRAALPSSELGRELAEEAAAHERQLVERAAAVTACTIADLHAVSALAPDDTRRGVVVPNGVDTTALPFRRREDVKALRAEVLRHAGQLRDDHRPLLTFIGSWHQPNIEAATVLVDIARSRPDWLILLAGSHSSEFAEGRAGGETLPSNVSLIPTFDEGLLWPLIAGSDVVVNPMLSGSGSNLKIFDYLSVGTPVVSTDVGVRGIDAPTRLAEVVAPDRPSIMAGIERVLSPSNADRVTERSRVGREVVERTFSWPVLAEQWAHAILSVAPEELQSFTPLEHPPSLPLEPLIPLDTPPSLDPVIACIDDITRAAHNGTPPPQEITVDATLREHLRLATENRHAGRELPEGARLVAPKKALIRIGQAITNEQVVYNRASLDAVARLGDLVSELREELQQLSERVGTTEEQLRQANGEIERLRAQGRLIADARPPLAPPGENERTSTVSASTTSPNFDAFYQIFEDQLRSSELVEAHLQPHLAHFAGWTADALPVLDVGAGRGDWLELLASHGVAARGIDTNAAAVAEAHERGVDVVLADGMDYLAGLEPRSLAAITSFHVIEHLPAQSRLTFAELAHRALAPGGFLLVETPDPRNLQVGATGFWLDPTHERPVPPEQFAAMLTFAGFEGIEMHGLHPSDVEHPTSLDPDPERNGVLTEVHRLLFGSRDVAILARRGNT